MVGQSCRCIVYHFHLLYSCSPPYSFGPSSSSCSRFCLCWNILLSIITTASIIILSEFFINFQAHIYHQEITFNFMFYNLAIGSERKIENLFRMLCIDSHAFNKRRRENGNIFMYLSIYMMMMMPRDVDGEMR